MYMGRSSRAKVPENSKLLRGDLTLNINMMLITLLFGQRYQTIHAQDISAMQVPCHPNQQCVRRQDLGNSHLTLQAYPADEQIFQD